MGVSRVDSTEIMKIRKESENLATGVGLALAEWGAVETFMAFIFVAILDRSSHSVLSGRPWNKEPLQNRIAHASFNAIVSFDTRVDVLSAAIEESDLSKRLKSIWPGIASRLRKGYKKRHEAAHFMLDEMTQSDGSIKVMLTPFASTIFRYGSKQLNRDHLDHKAAQFREVGEALKWFRAQIDHKRRRLAGPRAPAPALVVRVLQSLKTQNSTKSD